MRPIQNKFLDTFIAPYIIYKNGKTYNLVEKHPFYYRYQREDMRNIFECFSEWDLRTLK